MAARARTTEHDVDPGEAAAAPEPEVDAADEHQAEHEPEEQSEVIERPTELIRIGTMLQTLVGEVREMKLDEAGRDRLARIHERAVEEIRGAVSDDLGAELAEYALPLDGPSEAELRIAQAQLLGWLEGLMRGIQAAVASRQLAAQQGAGQLAPGGAAPGVEDARGTGQYL